MAIRRIKGAAAQQEANKALGFVNVYVSTTAGNRKKVGFLMLTEGDAVHEQIAKAIDSKGIEEVLGKLEFVYNAVSDEPDMLDL